MHERHDGHRPMDIAFICTGNICRSPMGEGMLRARLAEVAPHLVVGSAGLLFDGRPAEPEAVKVMAKRGVDIESHQAQRISAGLLGEAALILGMERHHVREVAVLDPALWPRTYTLPEFSALAAEAGPRSPHQSLREWVELVGAMRSAADYAYDDPASEIADPYGGSARAYRVAASTIERHLDALVALAWPTPELGGDVAAATPGGSHADRHRR
jgi:protein-tyrosine phosphatase